jgi:anaerobic magnesium-protoporphyrin IX monomethyl ester cyclase
MEGKKIHKVLLISPSIRILDDSLKRLTTPLGLLYLGTALKKNGYEVKIINSPCEGYETVEDIGEDYEIFGLTDEEIKKKIKEFDPDIVGVGNLFSAQRERSVHHCRLVKEVKDVPVIAGGIHPTLSPRDMIVEDSVDYVVMGEGEHRMLDLLKGLNEGATDFDFDGIAYKKNGEIILNPMVSRLKDLDEFGVPDRTLVDMEAYISKGVFYAPFTRKKRVERVQVSRGCPGKCVFCAYTTGKRFFTRSVDNVMEEIDNLVKDYGIEEIQFSDDNLTLDRAKAMDLFNRMEPYNLAWCTPNGIFVKTLDEEFIAAAGRAGAYQLTFNIESASERILKDIIGKDVPPVERVAELVKACHDSGIQVHGQLMIGLPGETREEIEATLNYPYEVDFDSVSFFIANPLPGSQLFDICKRKGYLKENRVIDFKSSDLQIPPDDPDFIMYGEEMEQLVEEATRKYNEHIKKKYPERWAEKFKLFNELKKGALNTTGRVT